MCGENFWRMLQNCKRYVKRMPYRMETSLAMIDGIQIARCKLECLILALTCFLVLLDWFRAEIFLQQIRPVTWSKLKNLAAAVIKVWRATRPSSLPIWTCFDDILENSSRRVHWLAVQTMIHPEPLTVLAFSLSYDPSVMPTKVPFISASLIYSTLASPSSTSSHIHSPPSDLKSTQNGTAKVLTRARGGPMSLQSTCSFCSSRTFTGMLHAGTWSVRCDCW